jgi:hypothetical protein
MTVCREDAKAQSKARVFPYELFAPWRLRVKKHYLSSDTFHPVGDATA